jgi:hypothetical protein
MAEIQRADMQRLKLAILALVMLLLGGVVLSVQVEAWLAEVRRMPVEFARKPLTTVFSWSVGIVAVAIALAGCHVWRWARRGRQTLRFPPPGATVVRDTVVLVGRSAESRGTLLQVLGVTLILCAAGVAVVSWWVLRMLGNIHG